MDEQDEYLRQIIAAVGQHPGGSLERRKAMHQLLSYVQRLPGLARCSHPEYPDVLNATLTMVSIRVQEFQPRSLAVWQPGSITDSAIDTES